MRSDGRSRPPSMRMVGTGQSPPVVRQRPSIGVAVALLLLAFLSGCGTTLVGGRVPRKASPNTQTLSGFPYVLTRPEFVLTRDDKGIDALAVRWVPDLQHIYTLRLDPAALSDSKFTLALNTNGSIKTLATSSTENITPTLKVIGQVAAAAVGIASALNAPGGSEFIALNVLSPDDWTTAALALGYREEDVRRVAIEAIEREIAAIESDDAANRRSQPSPQLADLRREWAVAIGAFEEHQIEQRLLTLLGGDVRPPLAERPQAEAVRDYDRARLQLVEVRRSMTEKRTKFKRPTPPALRNPRNDVVDELDLDAVAASAGMTPAQFKDVISKRPDNPVVTEAIGKAVDGASARFVVVRHIDSKAKSP